MNQKFPTEKCLLVFIEIPQRYSAPQKAKIQIILNTNKKNCLNML